jgi:uncharacterized protein
LIDSIQYHCPVRETLLPPASYSLVQQVNGRGVFSFCMCPGGIIAPASTSPDELVVNGWSPSKRNNAYANSGIVVQVEEQDAFEALLDGQQDNKKKQTGKDPLLFMKFQKMVEQSCYAAGGGNFVAPAQRMTDFSEGRLSNTLPGCSYQPGLRSSQLPAILPGFIHRSLASAFVQFGKKMPGYYTREAVVLATESRTSSPVRIPRNPLTLVHPDLENFYPCGEGAGYAGGIVSAAMDGERMAMQLARVLQ